MRMAALIAAAVLGLSAAATRADDSAANRTVIRGCIIAAARVHRLPPVMLVILLNVEGGSLGRVSPNPNGTVDLGPIQINTVNVPDVAAHWHASIAGTYRALRDNFCANLEAGAWVLRRELDGAGGDFWDGVGDYHSHAPAYRTRYLRAVLDQVLRLRASAAAALAARPPVPQTASASSPGG
jgi:hypothetical protein